MGKYQDGYYDGKKDGILKGLKMAREAGPSKIPSTSKEGDWFNDACEEWETAIDELIEKEKKNE